MFRSFLFFMFFFSTIAIADQKVVFITGANGGIGIATTKAFQEKGWKVWAGYHKQKPYDLMHLKDVRLVRLDLTNEEQMHAAINIILQEEGRIDALINNAGYGLIGAEETVTLEDAHHIFNVNFFGPFRLIQYVAPIMRRQKSGHIINLSSTSGVRAVPGLGLYAASKFALEGLSESLAVTLSPWNIQVSIVEPGTVKNNWVNNCIHGSRVCDEREFYSKLSDMLTSKLIILSEVGQECEEIGTLIVKIAETEWPDMRYQTSEKVQTTVAKKHVDITGNVMRDEQLQFFNNLLGLK